VKNQTQQQPAARAPAATGERASRTPLSRNQVVEAAISAIHAGQYQKMTIRTLAADLDVAPRSLYRHIRNRDDLLDEVCDRLWSISWRPTTSTERWQT
jgi:AcrR family transcriptional regulator